MMEPKPSSARLRNVLFIATVFVASLLAQGCNSGGSSGGSSLPPNLFAYVTNEAPNGKVSGFSVNPSTGALTPLAGSPFTGTTAFPTIIVAHPNGTLLYTGDPSTNTFDGYPISAQTGAISPLTGGFFLGSAPNSYAMHANGWLYVAGPDDDVDAFSTTPTNAAITGLPGAPLPSGGIRPQSVALNPTGNLLFVANRDSPNVSVFSVNAGSGAINQIGSPTATPPGSKPIFLLADATGDFLYVLSSQDSKIYAYSIGSGGVLAPLSPASYAAPSTPIYAAHAPNANFLYVTSGGATNEVSVYSINASNGSLTEIAGSPFVTDPQPTSIAFTPSGQFAYVVSQTGQSIEQYSVNSSTGALVAVGAPVSGGVVPTQIVVVETHP